MTVNRSDFQKQLMSGVTATDKIIVLDDGGTDEPGVVTAANLAGSAPFTSTLVTSSTLTTDGDVLTRTSGAPARITRADLAQDSAFSSRYKPLASDRIWINANEFIATNGSPTIGVLNAGGSNLTRTGVYLFDAATVQNVAAAFAPPPGWTTFTANVYWSNAGAGAGDVVWTVAGLTLGDGDSTTAAVSTGNVTATAPAQDVVEVSAAGTTFSVSTGKIHRMTVRRVANDVADTLANEAALLGIEVVRAS